MLHVDWLTYCILNDYMFPMSLEDRKTLDEVMKDNPLWQHHRRMMEPLLCPELLDPTFEVRQLIFDSFEGRSAAAPLSVPMEVPDTDAKTLFQRERKDESLQQ
jgi:hypothetical protein